MQFLGQGREVAQLTQLHLSTSASRLRMLAYRTPALGRNLHLDVIDYDDVDTYRSLFDINREY
jgi:hypothetical protein